MDKTTEVKYYEKINRQSECTTRQLTEEEKLKYTFNERKRMTKNLLIDEQLRDLFPPLTKEEFEQLEANILRDGCTSPIFIWNGYIVDGHNRYNICSKHNMEFQTITLAYDTKDEVIQWMIDTQLGRRNLTPIQRIAIAEKYRHTLKRLADENKSNAGGAVPQKSAKPIDVRDELAKVAGVSHDTYSKGKKILESDNETIKQEVLNGDKKINTAYNELFGKPKAETEEVKPPEPEIKLNESKPTIKPKTKTCIKCGSEKLLDEFYIGHDKCKECEITPSSQTSRVNKGEIFKDIQGNPLPIDKELFNQDEMKQIRDDIKTPKVYQDYVNVDNEIELTKQICEDLIEQLDLKFITLHKIVNKMNDEQILSVIGVLNKHIGEIEQIKIKVLNNKGV